MYNILSTYIVFSHFNIYEYIILALYNNYQINIPACLAIYSHRIYIMSARKFVKLVNTNSNVYVVYYAFNHHVTKAQKVQSFTSFGLLRRACHVLQLSSLSRRFTSVTAATARTDRIVHRRVNKLNCTFQPNNAEYTTKRPR